MLLAPTPTPTPGKQQHVHQQGHRMLPTCKTAEASAMFTLRPYERCHLLPEQQAGFHVHSFGCDMALCAAPLQLHLSHRY
jgi:hypothetical protein